MRTVWLVAAFTALVHPAFAQATRVTAPLPRGQDTSIRILRLTVTPDMARQLKQKIEELATVTVRLEARLLKDLRDTTTSREHLSVSQEVLARHTFDLLSAKTQLVRACLELRRPDGESTPGTLGLHIDKPVRFVLDSSGQGQSFTMTFDGRPRIEAVDPGSPAEKAGVRAGDLWTAINGRPLVGEVRFDELLTPGASVTIRVIRSGREHELPVVHVAKRVSEYPDDACSSDNQFEAFSIPLVEMRRLPGVAPRTVFPRPLPPGGGTVQIFVLQPAANAQFGGAVLQALDGDWRENLGIEGDGLGVIEVGAGTSAESAGLRKFDVIRQVNGETVNSPAAFLRLVGDRRAIELTVFNKAGGTRTVRLSR